MGVVGAGTAAAAPASTTTDPPACTIQAAGNARYVAWVYQKIMYRCPDSGGLAFWTAQLNNGMSRLAFTTALDNSQENIVKNNVVADFMTVLDRQPSHDEITQWAPKVISERGDADILATLYSSDEYWNALPSEGRTAAFIATLYDKMLDRVGDQSVSDPQGFSFYMLVLGANPTEAQRYYVAYHYFERSTENAHDWVWAAYFAGFGRPTDPSGGVFWTDWVLNNNFRTFDMWVNLLSSNEGYNDAQANQNSVPPAP
jgi:hypothetical protein